MAKKKLLCALALIAAFNAPSLSVWGQVPTNEEIIAHGERLRDNSIDTQEIEEMVKKAMERVDALVNTAREMTKDVKVPIDKAGEDLSGFRLPEASAEERATLYIFVSSEMPRTLIKQYMKDAVRYRGTVVLRGLIGNSMGGTISVIQSIVEENDGEGGLTIDPKTFDAFGVKVVPAIVLAEDPTEICTSSDCAIEAPPHDKITGSVSIQYALEAFAKEGDLKTLSELRLEEGRSE